MAMRRLRISRGGQVSVPADIRHRWKTNTVLAEDRGDTLVLKPAEDDPLKALRGSLKGRLEESSKQLRAKARSDEKAALLRRERRVLEGR